MVAKRAMTRADYPVVLDACVLVPPMVCDLFLRLAETPRLYLPKWSEETLEEVSRNQVRVLGFTDDLAQYWRQEVTRSFPDAHVTGCAELATLCRNEPEDRHVLAAAIKARAQTIVTFNTRHFGKEALEPWDVAVATPSQYLLTLYEHEPAVVIAKLDDMSRRRNKSRVELLIQLRKSVRGFVAKVCEDLQLDLA